MMQLPHPPMSPDPYEEARLPDAEDGLAEGGRAEDSPSENSRAESASVVPERPFAVIRIGLGLLLILVAVLALIPRPAAALDGMQLLAERYQGSGTPSGYPLVRAERFRGGEELLTFGDASEIEAEDARLAATKIVTGMPMGGPMGGGMGGGAGGGMGGRSALGGGSMHGGAALGGGGERRDWAALTKGKKPGPPLEVALVWYPYQLAKKHLSEEFGSVQYTDIGQLGALGGVALIESGYVDWSDYQVQYRLERHFELHDGQPAFRDKLRANLSTGRLGNVLHLRWATGVPGDKRALESALRDLVPLS